MSTFHRADDPGTEHHVIQTAVANTRIFSHPAARAFYLERLRVVSIEERARIRAFAIMDTHVHLVLWVGTELTRLMSRIATSFALYYNRRHGRRGHVFGAEYWNTPIFSEPQFLLTARYVILNPVTAGIVASPRALAQSDRTNYRALMGLRDPFPFDSATTLARFGVPPERGRAELSAFLARGNENFDPYDPKVDGAVWDQERTDSHEARIAEERRIALVSARERAGWTLDAVILFTCARLGVECEALLSGSRNTVVSNARACVAYLARVELDMTLTQIAGRLRVTKQSVAQAVPNGKRVAESANVTLSVEGPGAR